MTLRHLTTFLLLGLFAVTASSCATVPKRPANRSVESLLVEWLKTNQDTASPEQNLLTDTFTSLSAQTFNNSLTALAFVVVDERERAERILDFYDARVDPSNERTRLQNLFCHGELRGFYQHMAIRDEGDNRKHHGIWNGDRWMGDIAWLYMAYRQHEKRYASDQYAQIIKYLEDLLTMWFVPQSEGGYVGSGWRNFDERLHEDHGHPEGNIDAYAVFKMMGNEELADRVAAWLLPVLQGTSRPLDHYSWKILAFAPAYAEELDIIENVAGYKKTLTLRGESVTGFTAFSTPDLNIWSDGLGHVAASYNAVGQHDVADYYLAQMEKLLIPELRGGRYIWGIPYTATQTPGYEWVNLEEGFVSCAAWYIMAKHRFNPMQL